MVYDSLIDPISHHFVRCLIPHARNLHDHLRFLCANLYNGFCRIRAAKCFSLYEYPRVWPNRESMNDHDMLLFRRPPANWEFVESRNQMGGPVGRQPITAHCQRLNGLIPSRARASVSGNADQVEWLVKCQTKQVCCKRNIPSQHYCNYVETKQHYQWEDCHGSISSLGEGKCLY